MRASQEMMQTHTEREKDKAMFQPDRTSSPHSGGGSCDPWGWKSVMTQNDVGKNCSREE